MNNLGNRLDFWDGNLISGTPFNWMPALFLCQFRESIVILLRMENRK